MTGLLLQNNFLIHRRIDGENLKNNTLDAFLINWRENPGTADYFKNSTWFVEPFLGVHSKQNSTGAYLEIQMGK